MRAAAQRAPSMPADGRPATMSSRPAAAAARRFTRSISASCSTVSFCVSSEPSADREDLEVAAEIGGDEIAEQVDDAETLSGADPLAAA